MEAAVGPPRTRGLQVPEPEGLVRLGGISESSGAQQKGLPTPTVAKAGSRVEGVRAQSCSASF